MSFHYRVRTIYGKELVDILRDRRTLIAMIVVPIVLYPLLMLGSIQAVSIQSSSLQEQDVIIGVINEAQKNSLSNLIMDDARAIDRLRTQLDPDSEAAKELPVPLSRVFIDVCGTVDDLDRKLRRREIHVGVVFDRDMLIDAYDQQNGIEIRADWEEMRSQSAAYRLKEMVARLTERTRTERKTVLDLPPLFDVPFKVTTVDLSSPPSVLGQVLPLVLVLMTITGAIYPAIDLTAGERERGTLESLMVTPVPIIDLIVGKFLVVATVAIMGAALNLASVSATVYFGGIDKVIADGGEGVPVGTMLLILACLIPFAVLMSAIMIAVCSYARTFKEAQNYVTPVILAVLIPGGIAALPATQSEGVMLVMPVGNMVLLSRDLLLGVSVPTWQILLVLLSTSLYAAAAVAVAAGIFGKESVVFADSGSLKASFTRGLMKRTASPTPAMALLVVALLFPIWFFVQSSLAPDAAEQNVTGLLYDTGWAMPLFFVVLPSAVLLYWKVDLRSSFSLRLPSMRYVLGAGLIGLSVWTIAYEINLFQAQWIGMPEALLKNAELLEQALASLPFIHAITLIALVPAFCEELLFRGFLLGGLRDSAGKWGSILATAASFAVFHIFFFKLPVTMLLGVVLGYLCWQARSILPAMLAHALHNGFIATRALRPELGEYLGIPKAEGTAHLPWHLIVGGLCMTALGLWIVSQRSGERATSSASTLSPVTTAETHVI